MNKPATFTTKIDISLADKFKNDLIEQGFNISTPPYTLFSAKKNGVICSLYTSGSLVVQGKDKDEFIEFYLEPEILKSFEYSHPEALVDMESRIGVDESGKGDFFGPLCVAALFADEAGIKKLISLHVQDSKRMTDGAVLKTASKLKKEFAYSVVCLFPEKYNELYSKFKNLNFLLGWAHATAIANLHSKTNCQNVLIDQFADKKVVEEAIKKKNIDIILTQRHKGESDVVVAAASIVARAHFLEGLEKLHQSLGIALPKGASKKVVDTGIKIALKFGKDELNKYAKTHFKTYQDIFANLEQS
jgi:ribonuclease HIII